MDKVLDALVARISRDLKARGVGTYEGMADGYSFRVTFLLSSQDILPKDELVIRRGIKETDQWIEWLSLRCGDRAPSSEHGPHVYVSYDNPSSNVNFTGDIELRT